MRSFVGKVSAREKKKRELQIESEPISIEPPSFDLDLSTSSDPDLLLLIVPLFLHPPPEITNQVISTAMMKTVMVAVERFAVVPKYRVRVRRTKKLMAHDEEGACLLGDTVRVEACRPLSKRKTWVVSEILRRERTLGGSSSGGEAAAVGAAAAAAAASPFSTSAAGSSRGFAASAFFRGNSL